MQVDNILEHHYGITDASATKLEGYDSINYKVKSKKGTYFLKENPFSY